MYYVYVCASERARVGKGGERESRHMLLDLGRHSHFLYTQSRQNVFSLPHVHRCCSISELRRLPYPQVVLASGLDLETSSFALDLFAEWTADHRNHVILTQKARPGCLARRLHDAVTTNRPIPTQAVVLQIYERVPLEGRELLEHQEKKRLAELEAKQKLEEEVDIFKSKLCSNFV